MSELETIFSEAKEFKVRGRTIKIWTVSLGNIPVVLSIFTKLSDVIGKKGFDSKMAAKVIGENFDDVIKLIGITTDLPKDDIVNLNMAAALELITHILKENSDFLQQHVAPVLKDLVEKVGSLSKSKS